MDAVNTTIGTKYQEILSELNNKAEADENVTMNRACGSVLTSGSYLCSSIW